MVVWEALDALSHQFELCKIGADSRVVVVVGDTTTTDRVALVRAAVARSGADSAELRPIGTGPRIDESSLLTDIGATADLVILTEPLVNIAVGDKQALLVLGDCEPQAFPPHATMARRVRSLHKRLAGASLLELSDPHGTDLRIDLSGSSTTSDSGILDARNRRTSFPAGWVGSIPAHNTVNGDLIVMPGDANLGAQRLISSPVRLHIIDDHVSAIEGDNPDADVLRALFEYAHEPSAYGLAGISIGMNPGRERAAAFDTRLLDPQLARLLAGVVTISFGENLLADRPCSQTVTLALSGRRVFLDDLPVVGDGHLQGDFAPDVYES